MKTRAELKQEIKQLFKGRWKSAILLCIVVSLLSIFSVASNSSDQVQSWRGEDTLSDAAVNQVMNLTGADIAIILTVFLVMILIAIVFSIIVQLFKVGTSFSMLDWVRQPEREVHAAADSTVGFTKKYAWPIVGLSILQGIFLFLWTLLLIVPGIIKAYAYSQTYYVYKDMLAQTSAGDPKPRLSDAITRSRQLMVGHKWELFVLQLSFIGWTILSALTFGIGQLWLVPYQYGTYANYYDNLVETAA